MNEWHDRASAAGWVGIAALIAFISMALLPFGLLILGAFFTVGGGVGYRQNRDPKVRAIAAGTFAGGIACFLMLPLMLVYFAITG